MKAIRPFQGYFATKQYPPRGQWGPMWMSGWSARLRARYSEPHGRKAAAVGGDPIVERLPDHAAQYRHVKERNLPPQAGHPQHDVPISLEPGQDPSIGQYQM